MRQSTVLTEFEQYLLELSAACRAHPSVNGLVLMGSTADRFRVDEWSDHDFAVVCDTGAQESLRRDLSWLPRYDTLAFVAREHHDGFKGVYRTGEVIEFAVVDRAELATFHANAWEVAYDEDGDLGALMRQVAARPKLGDAMDARRDFDVFLASLVIGVGRRRRGEILSASSVIRGQALDHLLAVISAIDGVDHRADNLDLRRRFEVAHPGWRIGELLDRDVEAAARGMLDCADRLLPARWAQYPANNVEVVRRRLGWGS